MDSRTVFNAMVQQRHCESLLLRRRVTQVPEGDYFLVWRKEGAAPAAVAPVQAGRDDVVRPLASSAHV